MAIFSRRSSSHPRNPTREQNPVQRRRAERDALSAGIRRAEPAPEGAELREVPSNPRKGPLTGRLLLLVVLLIFSGFILAPQLKVYMAQRQEVQALNADIARQQQEQDQLKTELSRYSDNAYIQQQARERLFMVMPGETRFMTTGALPESGEAVQGSAASQKNLSWGGSYLEALLQSSR